MMRPDLLAAVLSRQAELYIHQSNPTQVVMNLASQRRPYDRVEMARNNGFRDIEKIHDDLGRTSSGTADRPGFDRLVAWKNENEFGTVLCLGAARLARNGRDRERLLEVCSFVGTLVIEFRQICCPTLPEERLLPGLQGTFAAFELGHLRHRMLEAAQARIRRGEVCTLRSRQVSYGIAELTSISIPANCCNRQSGKYLCAFRDWVV